MKLYLSSNRVGANSSVLRDLVTTGNRALLIFNALDVFEKRMRDAKSNTKDIARLGFDCEELDLRLYFGHFEELVERIAAVDLVWAVGGNTFSLARAMLHSRFKEALVPQLSTDRVVYGGYSAGACAAGPDLQGCDLIDERDAISLGYPDGFRPEVEAEPLNLVSFRIVPHFRSDHEESEMAEEASSYLKDSDLEFRTISDGQAIVVDDDKITLV